jgi:hypothetical protein
VPDELKTPALGAGPSDGAAVAPPLGPRRDTAASGDASVGRQFRPAALGVALLVLLVGAIAGGGMFALEQSSVTWRPHATSTASGWRIAGPHGLPIHDAALSSGHLAWVSGPYTVMFDLSTGKSKLLGIARHAGADAPATVSELYAAWLEEADSGGLSIWTYQFSSSARRRLSDTPGVVWAPALSGATLVWAGQTGGSARDGTASTSITARDLSRGVDHVVAQGPSVDGPVTADGPRIGWFVRGTPPRYDVRDLAGGRLYSVDLLAGLAQADLTDVDLSGATLVWRLQAADGSDEILMRDLAGGTTLPVASGPGLSGGSIDEDVVVWAQPAGGGTSIMCRRLSGGSPFVVAAVSTGAVTDVLVGSGTVAWIVESGQSGLNWIETARLAQ